MSQRWRIAFARDQVGRDVPHRDLAAAWNEVLEALSAAAAAAATSGGRRDPDDDAMAADDREPARGRVTFAAPVLAGMTSRGELVDVVLPVGRLTLAQVRAIAGSRLPGGHRLVDAHDVWIGEPSLPALLDFAEYLVDVTAGEPDRTRADATAVRRSVAALLAERSLERPHREPGRGAADLRPLVNGLRVTDDQADGLRLWMRLRIDPGLGSGRPDEVVETLGRFGPSLLVVAVERVAFGLRPPPARIIRASGVPRPRRGVRLRGPRPD